MTLQEGRADIGRLQHQSQSTPRLRLKPKALSTGFVDGAWWPRSDDLGHELPDLLTVLSVRLGPEVRVTFNPVDWSTAPASLQTASLQTGGRSVVLEGTHLREAGTVAVTGADGKKLLLVVVPHCFDPDIAHEKMMEAAAPDNASRVDDLLMISAAERAARIRAAVKQLQWTAHG